MMQRSSAAGKRSIAETAMNLERMQELIERFRAADIIEKLLVDYPHTVFANEELIYLVENDTLQQRVRNAAYLALCDGGELDDLKRLAHLMDFSFADQCGLNAFHYAGIYNRPDVMSWLATYVELFREINMQDRTDIILYTVHNGSMDCLRLIDMPKPEGGLGWDVNVSKRGHTAVTIAAKARQYEMLKVLISSRDHGGCGLPIDNMTIRILGDQYKLRDFKNTQIKYSSNVLTKQESVIELASLTANKSVIYKPAGLLGEGAFGRVRLFQDEKNPVNTLAVKSMNFDTDLVDTDDGELLFDVLDIGKEINFLKSAYPDESPCGIEVFIDQYGRIDYRAVMPALSGLGLLATVINIIDSPSQFAALLLSIIKEINRIHELGIIHGDINMDNMLIIKSDELEYGLPVFKVHFIDFGAALYRNENATAFSYKGLFTPPELVRDVSAVLSSHPSQDIYSLSHAAGLSLAFRKKSDANFSDVLDRQFPSIRLLCESGTSDDPKERPALNSIIDSLSSELRQWSKNQILNKFSNISTSVRNMSLLFKRDSGKKCDSVPAANSVFSSRP